MALSGLIRKSRDRANRLRQSKEFDGMKDSFPQLQTQPISSCQLQSPPLEDPNFRFKLFDNLELMNEKYSFLKDRKEELKVEIWRKEQIQEAYRHPYCREQLEKQLPTVCQRSYLSNVFEEESYLSNSYLKDLFRAVIEENDKNTDILMVMMPDAAQNDQISSARCGDIINLGVPKQENEEKKSVMHFFKEDSQDDGIIPSLSPKTPNTPKTPNLDNKTPIPMNNKSGGYLMAGLMIVSYGYNLCACLPSELKDKYITLDILCSRQGTRGIGSLMMSSLLLCALEHKYTMIGLQVASSTFKSLESKKLKKGTNVEACLFYEHFGFFYDNRPRDAWFCFDPESSEVTTMLLDMENYPKPEEHFVQLCRNRLTKEGSSIPEKKLVLPTPSSKNTAFVPTKWQGRRFSRKRPANSEIEPQESKKLKREETFEVSPPPMRNSPAKAKAGRGKQPVNRKIEAGKKVEFILQSMQQVLSDGTPRSAKQLLEILRNPPFGVDFQAEKPLNTLTSILSKETIHFKKTTITRVPNSLPLLYTLKEFLGSKAKSRKSKSSSKTGHSKNGAISRESDYVETPSNTPLSNTSTPPSLLSPSPNEARNFIVPHEINIDSDTIKTLESENSNGSSGNPLTSPPLRSIEPTQYLPTSNLEFGDALEPLFENMETEPTPKLTNSGSNTPLFRSPEEIRKIGENSPRNSPRNPILTPPPAVIEEEIKNLPPDVCTVCREKSQELVPYMDYKMCKGCATRLVAWKAIQSVKKNQSKESS